MVVAENGALLYAPDTGKERPLCDPPEESFVRALKERGVTPLSVGRVIVAHVRAPRDHRAARVIKEQGLRAVR